MKKIKNIKEQLFFGSLTLVLITLSLPKYSLNSQSIILCVLCWLFYSSFQEKYRRLKENFTLFLIFSGLFWIALLGMIYSQNIPEGLKNLQKQLPFLIFPLLFFSVHITHHTKDALLKYFSYGVIISALFAITKAAYFKLNNFGDYFYYDRFEQLLQIHTTYFAMFAVIAIAYFTKKTLKTTWKKSFQHILAILFLLAVLYLLSVRVSIVALIVSTFILIFGQRKSLSPLAKGICLLLMGLILLLYITPNFQKRFNSKTPEGIDISTVSTRRIHWESVLEVINKNNLIFGAGTGDGHTILYDQYLKNKFETGYIFQYNAHNQFLETTLYYGIFGLCLLLLVLFTVFRRSFKNKDYLALSIVSVFIIFMFTESILERQHGIVIFAFIISFLTILTKRKRKELVIIGPYPPPVGGISLFIKKFEGFFKANFNENITIVNEFSGKNQDMIFSLSSESTVIYLLKLLKFLFFHNKANYIYYNGVHGLTRYLLVFLGKILGFKVIIHFHGRSVINFHQKNYVTKKLSEFTLNNAEKLIAVNPVISKKMKSINPLWDIINLPAFLPNTEKVFSEQIERFLTKIPPSKKYYLTYATLDKAQNAKYNYGIIDLIEFFGSERIKKTPYALILVLILYKKEHVIEYKEKIEPFLNNNIKVFINNGREPLIPFFKRVEGYIRWTFEDGVGGSLVEAMDAGLIAIATTVCERPEGVLLFDANNPDELERLINREHKVSSIPKTDFQIQYKRLFLSLGFTSK